MSKKLNFLPVVYINEFLGTSYKTAKEIAPEDWLRALGAIVLSTAGLDAAGSPDPVAALEQIAARHAYLEIVEG